MLMIIKAKIHANSRTVAVLKDAMHCATKVYNGLLWHLLKEYEEKGRVDISRNNLNLILKGLPRAMEYISMSGQFTYDEVIHAYNSFFVLRKQGYTRHQKKKRFFSGQMKSRLKSEDTGKRH
jgi:putative transposase